MHDHNIADEDLQDMVNMSQKDRNAKFNASAGHSGDLKMEDIVVLTRESQISEEQRENYAEIVESLLPGFDSSRFISGMPEDSVCHYTF